MHISENSHSIIVYGNFVTLNWKCWPYIELSNGKFWIRNFYNLKCWCAYTCKLVFMWWLLGFVFLFTDFVYSVLTMSFIMCIIFKQWGWGWNFLFIEHLYNHIIVSPFINFTFLFPMKFSWSLISKLVTSNLVCR